MMVRIVLLACVVLAMACHQTEKPPAVGDDPNLVSVKNDDPEMNAAIAKAVHTLPEFVACLEKPTAAQNTITLKARFEDSNGVEHMWLSDITHSNGNFSGILDDEPVIVKNVHTGDKVTVTKDRVSDWMVIEDGQMKGGYSIQLMMRDLSPEDLAAMKSAMGIR